MLNFVLSHERTRRKDKLLWKIHYLAVSLAPHTIYEPCGKETYGRNHRQKLMAQKLTLG